MFLGFARASIVSLPRSYSTAKSAFKVAVLGAAGGIGQPLSLLLKESDLISHLSLYDIAPVTPGVAADLSHICTPSKVTGHMGEAALGEALTGSNVVVIPAGVPRKPGMTRDDLFNTNAGIVANLAKACTQYCPKAHLLIITNPVNSMLPLAVEIYKKAGVYDKRRMFGVTTLDIVRANRFVSEVKGADVHKLDVTVVGGHSGATIIPLLSQIPGATFTQEEAQKLTNRIQFGGDEVVKAKAGAGSATLSMAYAGARFTTALLDALAGKKHVTACAFVESQMEPKTNYFASRIELTTEGVGKFLPVGRLSAYEQSIYNEMLPELQKNIARGIEFANQAASTQATAQKA